MLRRGRAYAYFSKRSKAGLDAVELRVDAASRHQRVVRAALDDFCIVDHENRIGAADGAEVVRDDDAGSAFHETLERLHDRVLGRGVESRRRLVEYEDRRVANDGTGDRNALTLTS